MPSLSQIMKSKTLMFGLLLTLASIAQMLVPYLPPAYVGLAGTATGVARVLDLRVRGDGGWIDQSQSARGRLGYVQAGGLILEVFFISNPQEMAVYQARKWLVAQAIADVLREVA